MPRRALPLSRCLFCCCRHQGPAGRDPQCSLPSPGALLGKLPQASDTRLQNPHFCPGAKFLVLKLRKTQNSKEKLIPQEETQPCGSPCRAEVCRPAGGGPGGSESLRGRAGITQSWAERRDCWGAQPLQRNSQRPTSGWGGGCGHGRVMGGGEAGRRLRDTHSSGKNSRGRLPAEIWHMAWLRRWLKPAVVGDL